MLTVAVSVIDLKGSTRIQGTQHFPSFVCTHDWPGPSGLCVAEALACGTQVVAFHWGNAAELIYDHVTGFICDSLEEIVTVLPFNIGELERRECCGAFEKLVSADSDRYLQLYEPSDRRR